MSAAVRSGNWRSRGCLVGPMGVLFGGKTHRTYLRILEVQDGLPMLVGPKPWAYLMQAYASKNIYFAVQNTHI